MHTTFEEIKAQIHNSTFAFLHHSSASHYMRTRFVHTRARFRKKTNYFEQTKKCNPFSSTTCLFDNWQWIWLQPAALLSARAYLFLFLFFHFCLKQKSNVCQYIDYQTTWKKHYSLYRYCRENKRKDVKRTHLPFRAANVVEFVKFLCP